MAKLNEKGHEILDPTPCAVPVNFKRPPTLQEQIRQCLKSERFNQYMNESGRETFEEADDFEVGEDYDPTSPYEIDFDPGESSPRQQAAGKGIEEETPIDQKARKKEQKSKSKPHDKQISEDDVSDD